MKTPSQLHLLVGLISCLLWSIHWILINCHLSIPTKMQFSFFRFSFSSFFYFFFFLISRMLCVLVCISDTKNLACLLEKLASIRQKTFIWKVLHVCCFVVLQHCRTLTWAVPLRIRWSSMDKKREFSSKVFNQHHRISC